MTLADTETRALFELHFRPNVELVSVVRRFVSDFYERILADADAVSRLALATHELLENAVKYSIDGATSLSISVSDGDAERTVAVKIWNRASPENIAVVERLLSGMQSSGDAFAYYQELMMKSVKSKDGSGLGLARVHAEGEMSMSHTVEGDQITIHADTHVLTRLS